MAVLAAALMGRAGVVYAAAPAGDADESVLRRTSSGMEPKRSLAACAAFSLSGDQLPWVAWLHRDSVGRTKPMRQPRHARAAIEGEDRSAAVPERHVTSTPVHA